MSKMSVVIFLVFFLLYSVFWLDLLVWLWSLGGRDQVR